MKEKGSVKVNLGVVICIIIIFILLAVCGAMYYFGFIEKGKVAENINKRETQGTQNIEIVNEIKNTTVENKEADKPTTTEKNSEKIDEGKDWVYSENKKYGKVPQINVNSETAKIFNEEINNEYNELEKYKREGSDGTYEYEEYINGDYISIVVKIGGANDSAQYSIYNINKKTGNSVSNLELINSRGMSKTEYLEKMKKASDKKYNEFKSRATTTDDRMLGETVNEINNSIDTPIFLDKDGKIDAIIREVTFAGASYYYFKVDVE